MEAAFACTAAVTRTQAPPRRSLAVSPVRAPPRMAAKGFGKRPDSPASRRQPSEASGAGDAAAERLDAMRKQGLPEFSVWVRLTEKESSEDPDFPWLPVGSLSVPRSGDIDKAIFDVYEDLMQGVYRLFPTMKGKEKQLQFGWQNKEFTDEDIRVAVKPSSMQFLFQSIATKLPKWGK